MSLSTVLLVVLGVALGVPPLLLGLRAVLDRPQRGVLLLAALVPFNGLLLLVPHAGLLTAWKEVLVVVVALAALVAPSAARAPRGRPLPPWWAALAGLAVLSLASAATVSPTQAIVSLKIVFFYVLVAWVLWRCPLDAGERDRLVSILMLTGVVAAVVGLAQQAIGADRLHQLGYTYNDTIRFAGGFLRSFSTFNQPFPFGLYVMAVLLVGTPVALENVRRTRNALFLMATPVLVAGMLSSIVRAAILGLVVGLAYLFRFRYRVLAHVVLPTVAVLLLVPAGLSKALSSSTSLGQRGAGWRDALLRVLHAPVGNGTGSTGAAAEKAATVAGRTASTYQPDNHYFKVLYELGPLGLWMFVLLLLSVGLMAVRTARRRDRLAPQDAALAAGVAASVGAAAAASLVATYFEIFPLDVLFWLLTGVVSSLHASSSKPSPSAPAAAGCRLTAASSWPPSTR